MTQKKTHQTKMQQAEAIAKAKNLWGKTAFAIIDAGEYCIGEEDGPIRQYYGVGGSWEEAFEDAHLTLQ